MSKKNIVCFGEVLWDLLPSGKIAGGAPMNVAVHATQLGLNATMISAVGNDDLGDGIKSFLESRQLSIENIQTLNDKQTGIVEVVLNEKGSPTYTIIEPVAWDFIGLTDSAEKKVIEADALVFGSLALRNEISKNTILALQAKAKLRILDINLRKPFYSAELAKELFEIADLVKVNDEELEMICAWYGQSGDELSNAKFLKNLFKLQGIIVTRGGNGAFFVDKNNEMAEHQGFKVEVNDTIGSGDSFLASFITKWLNGFSASKALEFACAVGAYVATQKGATPIINEADILEMIEKG
ncbi:ATP-dependent 6-phosphofructokinase [Emticicia aquatica]|uniref:ATP-dependent 6-phosphofructokinase n=1 Tax=Emticicia aquatica TaxID=1681835 RepID=A0ABN8EQI5_9BACT|nr:carbohydrate kinase [Emticicia aquatica]CAH0995169.1 ATP-dependent 6-phosphofructokinase [Emticicia aquatica]